VPRRSTTLPGKWLVDSRVFALEKEAWRSSYSCNSGVRPGSARQTIVGATDSRRHDHDRSLGEESANKLDPDYDHPRRPSPEYGARPAPGPGFSGTVRGSHAGGCRGLLAVFRADPPQTTRSGNGPQPEHAEALGPAQPPRFRFKPRKGARAPGRAIAAKLPGTGQACCCRRGDEQVRPRRPWKGLRGHFTRFPVRRRSNGGGERAGAYVCGFRCCFRFSRTPGGWGMFLRRVGTAAARRSGRNGFLHVDYTARITRWNTPR